MKRLVAAVLAGIAVSAPLALASAVPAQAAPYSNCSQARQNGDCDIPAGSDKYQSKLDRDGDGLGCEC